jgi:hypothetical protein
LGYPHSSAQIIEKIRLLYFAELKQGSIEIPFTQRDLHIRSGLPWQNINKSSSG